MENFGAFCNGEWDWEVLSKLFCDEELELTQQILHQFSFPLDKDQDLSFSTAFRFSPINGSSNGDICLHSSLHNNSQESSPCSNSRTDSFYMPALNNEIVPANSDHFGIPVADDFEFSMDFKDEHALTSKFLVDQVPVLENLKLVQPEELHLKRKLEVPDDVKMETCAPGNPKKKSRTSKYGHRKVTKKGKEDENGSDGQSYSSSSSEEEDASRETNGGSSTGSKSSQALNLTAKTRAGRGSASDPQSLYAKKRRERINERLRILQNLVPNGTKVDISTMLDEAVHYVKFLQLQIRLLSSDDLWMYAPLVYNGVDIGLNPKLSALL